MKIFGYSIEECLTFFMLIVVGYFIAKLFSQKCNGFSVGAVTCKDQNPGKCKILSNCRWNELESKCTNKYAPAPAPAVICNKNEDCKSGICHKNPITKLGNCVNKCSDLNPRACRVHPDKCRVENNNCMSKKGYGESCEENNECQSGVCHSKDFVDSYKCMKCSDVNVATCEKDPNGIIKGHGDVCKVTGKGLNRECTRKQ